MLPGLCNSGLAPSACATASTRLSRALPSWDSCCTTGVISLGFVDSAAGGAVIPKPNRARGSIALFNGPASFSNSFERSILSRKVHVRGFQKFESTLFGTHGARWGRSQDDALLDILQSVHVMLGCQAHLTASRRTRSGQDVFDHCNRLLRYVLRGWTRVT